MVLSHSLKFYYKWTAFRVLSANLCALDTDPGAETASESREILIQSSKQKTPDSDPKP